MRSMYQPLRVKLEAVGDTAVVRFHGSGIFLDDQSVPILGEQVGTQAEELGVRQLFLDFANVKLVCSTALAALIGLHKRMQSRGGHVSVFNLSDEVYEVFQVTRLNAYLDARRSEATTQRIPLRGPNPGILIVDDEPAVRTVLELALRRVGFSAWQTATGRQALELYARQPEVIDLVLLDVRMPDWDGPQTLAALRRLDPDVRCCFLTGDAGSYTEDELLALGAIMVLHKPFHLDELLEALTLVLDPPGPLV